LEENKTNQKPNFMERLKLRNNLPPTQVKLKNLLLENQ